MKVALITGGSSGIGQQVCKRLAEQGYDVIVGGTNKEKIKTTLAALTEGNHMALACDVSKEESVQQGVDKIKAKYGRLDVLVAAAGIGRMPGNTSVIPNPLSNMPLEEWNAFIDINLHGIFLINRAVLPLMSKQNSGHILNVGSAITPHGMKGQAYAGPYSATKFAVLGLTEALAEEAAPMGIRVQAFLPGLVKTPMVSHSALATKFGAPMSAESVAHAILFLIDQPLDTVIVHPHVIPFNTKNEVKK